MSKKNKSAQGESGKPILNLKPEDIKGGVFVAGSSVRIAELPVGLRNTSFVICYTDKVQGGDEVTRFYNGCARGNRGGYLLTVGNEHVRYLGARA